MTSSFHGGGFWNRIGEDFGSLDRRLEVINADVLDAWFDPAPSVLEALSQDLGWLSRTSPPTHAVGLVASLSQRLGIEDESILVGAGSSSLIYLCLGQWLRSSSKVLVPEPTYGEYAHYCDHVARCRCDRFLLAEQEAFRLDLARWVRTVNEGEYDLAVLVNPNNPTGQVLNSQELGDAVRQVRPETRVLIDEAYLDYCGCASQILLAAASKNVFVLKSLSKSLALSGVRAAYLSGPLEELVRLRQLTPPWAVSLPAQIAAVKALREPSYYQAQHKKTALIRAHLSCELARLGFSEQHGAANWLLCRVPSAYGKSSELTVEAASKGLYIRDAGMSAPSLGEAWVRFAVKDLETQKRMIDILSHF